MKVLAALITAACLAGAIWLFMSPGQSTTSNPEPTKGVVSEGTKALAGVSTSGPATAPRAPTEPYRVAHHALQSITSHLLVDDGLDEARIDGLLSNGKAFDTLLGELHAKANTDRDLADATWAFGARLQASLPATRSDSAMMAFACDSQLCLAQLPHHPDVPRDMNAIMGQPGPLPFHAASFSAPVTGTDGRPMIRAVLAIDPSITRITQKGDGGN